MPIAGAVLLVLQVFVTPIVHAESSPEAAPVSTGNQRWLQEAKEFEQSQRYAEATERYRRYLAEHPEDDEVRGSLARVLSWQEEYREAEELYRDILSRHPTDQDIRAALARLLSWQKRFPEAQKIYEEILLENPSNWEAERGLADVFLWSGRHKDALRHYETVLAATQDPEVARRVEGLKAERSPVAPVGGTPDILRLPYRDYLKAGYSHFSYTKGLPDERDFLIEAAKPLGDKTFIARIEPLNRFGFHDTPVSAELYSPLWQRAWGYIGAQATVNPSFAPNYSVVADLYQGLGAVYPRFSPLELSFGYRRLLYKKDNIDLLLPGFNLYLPFNVWVTEKVYYVPDTGSITLSSQITWRPTDRIQMYASYGFGTSGERIVATQDFIRVNSRIVQGGVIFPISTKLSGEANLYYEDRSTLYIRRGGTFNLIYHW
ncbi:MAG TPA: tetratricopeptide repeat protein [Nitrospira sp.]|nr:tetratricopeptide repeat protein [Nitrospira sp.]